jgi:N-hydroxyarylamine O-acetyltransferase
MPTLDDLFRKRIGYLGPIGLGFDDLPTLLVATSRALPFENLSVVERRGLPITRDNLIEKLLVGNEGGLCYELNPLLYFYLRDCGFDVSMMRGIVYNPEAKAFAGTGPTHVTLLLRHQDETYLVDTGFGGFLPLRPVPLNGAPVESANGWFRVRTASDEHAIHGNLVFELKQRYQDSDWRIGYVFDSRQPISTLECEEIRRIIAEHPASKFNTRPLATKLTERGSITLTDTSLTRMEEGSMTKESVTPERFQDLLALHFRPA